MAGPLGVTHLLLFSRSDSGNINFRIALTPRGPTLHFRVDKYSLCKDVAKSQKRPRTGSLKEYHSPPLLVMNNFTTNTEEPRLKQLESLTTTIFQSLFPPISPQNTPLTAIRRVLLLNRELGKEGTYLLNLRHYAITTRRTGVSKRIRRLDPKETRSREKKGQALPNLGKLDDIADYLLDPSMGDYTSASETEIDTDAEVEVMEMATQRVQSKKEKQQRPQNGEHVDQTPKINVEKRAVKLVELGPRMNLRMVKVEEGICEGRTMWHEFIAKSREEEKELEQRWEERKRQKEKRRRVQRENVERKKLARKNAKANARSGKDAEDEEDKSSDEEWDSDEIEEELEAEKESDRDD